MRPSIKWFPLSLTERAAWYRNFNYHLQMIGPDLGLTAGELAMVQTDCDMLVFLAQATGPVANFAKSFETFRRVITEHRDVGTDPQFPTLQTLTPPAGARPGIFDRLARLVPRIRTAPNFTSETAALLGIEPKLYRRRLTHLEDGASPTITAFAQPGNVVILKFVRGASSGVLVEMLVDNDEEWQFGGKFFKPPGEVVVPASDDAPHRVQLRARFLHGNDPVGDWSSIVTVVTHL